MTTPSNKATAYAPTTKAQLLCCTSHHHACPCREVAHQDVVNELQKAQREAQFYRGHAERLNEALEWLGYATTYNQARAQFEKEEMGR